MHKMCQPEGYCQVTVLSKPIGAAQRTVGPEGARRAGPALLRRAEMPALQRTGGGGKRAEAVWDGTSSARSAASRPASGVPRQPLPEPPGEGEEREQVDGHQRAVAEHEGLVPALVAGQVE